MEVMEDMEDIEATDAGYECIMIPLGLLGELTETWLLKLAVRSGVAGG